MINFLGMGAAMADLAAAGVRAAHAVRSLNVRLFDFALRGEIEAQRKWVARVENWQAEQPRKYRGKPEPDCGIASKGRRGAAQRAALQSAVLATRRRVRKRRVGL